MAKPERWREKDTEEGNVSSPQASPTAVVCHNKCVDANKRAVGLQLLVCFRISVVVRGTDLPSESACLLCVFLSWCVAMF